MSKEWPNKKEREQNIRLYKQLVKKSKILITQDDIDSYHELMRLSPSKRLEIAVSMITPMRRGRRRRIKHDEYE
jgi:hypothetical protein